MNTDSWAVEYRNVTKKFGSFIANNALEFKVRAGTIHALVGENGAGKSTAMKCLSGHLTPDSGEILVFGQVVKFSSPMDSIRAGIGMVYQHFMLAERLSVYENVVLGAEKTGAFFSFISEECKNEIRELSQKYGLDLPLEAEVRSLSVGQKQRLEILKALYRKAQILVLDEPTAVLTPAEVQFFFASLKILKSEGRTILLITHKLKEVMGISDDVTVLRQGKITASLPTHSISSEQLAELMVGRKILPQNSERSSAQSRTVLSVQNLSVRRNHKMSLTQVSFEIKAGEILGVAGVEGNGQESLISAIVRPRALSHKVEGAITLNGENLLPFTTETVYAKGVSLIPSDRHREGLILDESIEMNFILGQQKFYQKGSAAIGYLDRTRIKVACEAAILDFDIRPTDRRLAIRHLSGGNQQKVIIAREFKRKPKLLIAAQPTRGVDIGAIEAIHQRILKARDEGMAVLLISSELDEILELSDRIVVLFEGKIGAEYTRGRVSESELGAHLGGVTRSALEHTP